MTNLVDRPTPDRGGRRRDQLVEAGLAVLAEGGWAAVTTRAVAERAGANLGLIHYHFGGLANLHVAIARLAGELVVEPLLQELLGAEDLRAGIERFGALLPVAADDSRISRLSVELIAGAVRAPELGEVLRDQLRIGRERIADWLGGRHPDWSPARRLGAATLLAALLDGLVLHRLLDPELPADQAVAALRDLVAS